MSTKKPVKHTLIILVIYFYINCFHKFLRIGIPYIKDKNIVVVLTLLANVNKNKERKFSRTYLIGF